MIGIIHKRIFKISCHLIQGPVALYTQEVDEEPYPHAMDESNNDQWHYGAYMMSMISTI